MCDDCAGSHTPSFATPETPEADPSGVLPKAPNALIIK